MTRACFNVVVVLGILFIHLSASLFVTSLGVPEAFVTWVANNAQQSFVARQRSVHIVEGPKIASERPVDLDKGDVPGTVIRSLNPLLSGDDIDAISRLDLGSLD
jgi:hypothetical protein